MIYVTVSGSHGTFDAEFEAIRQTLESLGVEVTVENELPTNPAEIELMKRQAANGVKFQAKLIAEHWR